MIYEEEGLWELCGGNYTQNATVDNKQPPSWIKIVLKIWAFGYYTIAFNECKKF